MADYVVTATLVDNMSDPANAASAAMDKAAASADNMAAAITRAGPSAQALINQFDPLTASTLALQKAQTALAAGTATMDAAVAGGTATAEQAAVVVAGLSTKVSAARDAMAAAVPAAAGMTEAHVAAAAAADGAGYATAGFTRELIVLGHETLVGNYNRLPGSLMVLAERTGNLHPIIEAAGAAFTSFGGILGIVGVAAVATAGYFVYSAYEQSKALEGLKENLALTRADYDSLAVSAQNAASAIGGSKQGKTKSASAVDIQATQTIAGVAEFSGDPAQLADLVALTKELSAAMGTNVPAAAKLMADSLKDPEAEAKKLADEGWRYLDDATVATIKHLQDSGDTMAAQALLIDRLRIALSAVADSYKSVADQAEAWRKAAQSAHAFSPNAGARPDAGSPLLGPMVNGEQAVGMFQVQPSTAAALGFSPADIATTGGNIQAGIAVLLQKYFQSGGNVDAALALYGGYGNDVNAASGYIASVHGAGPAALDPGVLSAIQAAAAGRGLPADLEQIAEKLAVVESRGRQFAGSPDNFPGGASAGPGLAAPGSIYGPGMPTPAQLAAGQAVSVNVNDIMRATANVPVAPTLLNAAKIQTTQDTLTALEKAQSEVAQGTPEWQTFADRIAGAQAELTKLQNPLQATIDKVQGEAAAFLKGADATDQGRVALLQATAAAQAHSQAAGKAGDAEGALAAAILNKNAAQEADKGATVVQNLHDQAVAAQAAVDALQMGPTEEHQATLAALIDKTTVSMRAARDAATDPGVKNALQGEIDQTTALLSLNDNLKTQAQDLTALQTVQSNLDYLQKEVSLVGASADDRARELAAFKEIQALTKEGADPANLTATQQALVQMAQNTADVTAELQRQQSAWNAISGVAGQVADQIGQGIVTAFTNGNGAAVNFGNIARAALASVAEEALKLALINPVVNSLFGTTSPTLGALFGSSASGAAGSSGGTSSLGIGTLFQALGLAGNSGVLSSLGITGPGGLLGSLGGSSSGGLLSGVTGFLNTGLLGGTSAAATDAALAGMGGSFGPETLSAYSAAGGTTVGLPAATFGTLLSGVGLGTPSNSNTKAGEAA